jgi:serine/threonine protein kinase
VLVSDEGRALITDFGVSHIATHLTKQGTTQAVIAHSAHFAAPEVLKNLFEGTRIRPDKPCDIWSFGCLCYEVRTWFLPRVFTSNDVNHRY